jgi:hypothetical protein
MDTAPPLRVIEISEMNCPAHARLGARRAESLLNAVEAERALPHVPYGGTTGYAGPVLTVLGRVLLGTRARFSPYSGECCFSYAVGEA